MRALYWRRPTAAELAEFGLKPEDYPEPVFELWSENEAAIDLYVLFSTQWRVGMSGAVGLDYGPILHHLDRLGVSGEQHDDLMASIRVIERAAMDEFEKK